MNYEFTDTFGGEANYSWVERGTIDASDLRSALRKAKKVLGLTGVRGRITMDCGDLIAWRPYGSCTILFISWGD